MPAPVRLFVGLVDRWMESLLFEIRLRKSEFYVGEPIIATVVWCNESRISLGVEFWGSFGGQGPLGYHWGIELERDFEMRVVYEDGQELESHARPVGGVLLVQEPLPPGWEIQRSVRLKKAFDLSREGHYNIQVTYGPWFGGVDGDSWFFERWLTKRFRWVAEARFKVIPWREGSLSDARALAAAGDPGGAHLLGLHGGEDAVSLLLECLASEDRELRYEAAHALARVGSSAAIDGLGDAAVKELDPKLKSVMVRLLINLDSPDTFSWLKMMLEDTVVVSEATDRSGQRIRFYHLRASIVSHLQNRDQEVEAIWVEVISDSK